MTHLIKQAVVFAGVILIFSACSKESSLLTTSDVAPVDEVALANDITLNRALTPQVSILDEAAAKSTKSLAIWADCEGFSTLGTPTSFKPTAGNFDELYNMGNFKDGLGAISESKPGDQDFNGGRWHVNSLKEGVDPTKYLDACSVEDLDLNDFESTDTYFECPLLPVRGKGHE